MSDTGKTIALIKALGGGGGGGSSFDPTISNPQDGQVLVYDGTAGKWVNGAASGGGAMIVPTFTPTSETTATCDMTLQEILNAIDAKQCFFARSVLTGGYRYYTVAEYNNGEGDKYVEFDYVNVTEQAISLMYIIYDSEGILLDNTLYPSN